MFEQFPGLSKWRGQTGWDLTRRLIRRFEGNERMLSLLLRLETWDENEEGPLLIFVGVEAFETPTPNTEYFEQE